jgi:hypothetical protein
MVLPPRPRLHEPCPPDNVLKVTRAPALALDFFYNLFCNFGNILKIVRKCREGSLFLHFERSGYSQAALAFIQGLPVEGCLLHCEWASLA